jgi:hypothetical protein
MPISSLANHADSCLDRDYLVRWFPDNLQKKGNTIGFSEPELAIVEEALRRISNQESLLIHNPLPCNRIPVAFCLAYVRTQDPRFPSHGFVGEDDTLLAFPALSKGYLSTIDSIKLDGIGQNPRLIDREPVGALSELHGSGEFFTAKHNFEFDLSRLRGDVGAVFVDLRKPEWGAYGRRFGEILSMAEESKRPVIFYTDEFTDESVALQQQMDTVEVTSKLLMTAKGMSVPNPGATAQFGHLISEADFSVEHISVGFPEMKSVVKDMTKMKNDLQEKRVANIEVGWLFNLLTKLPVRPEHWDDVTSSNYYQQGVRELLKNLRNKASRLETADANLLINYCHAADHLHGLLNRKHPVQDELFELIREAEENNLDRALLVRGEFERKAVLRAITIEDGPTASSVAIRDVTNVSPGEFDEAVICRPLDYDSYVYEFPLAHDLKFVQFESWTEIVQRRINRGLDVLNADIEVQQVGRFESDQEPAKAQSNGAPGAPQEDTQSPAPDAVSREIKEPTFDSSEPIENYVPDVDGASEEEVIETLEEEFKDSSRPTESGRGGDSGEAADLQFKLANGNIRTTSRHTRVTILRENGDIGRIQADDLSVDDTVVLVDSAADDIYDLFIESAHEKEKIRKCESVVERWRDTLKEGLKDINSDELLDELQQRGSSIQETVTIEWWADGSTIGPNDDEDVRRVFDIFDPEMKPTWEATVQAMKDIRTEHQQIGKQARRAIESQMGSSMAGELSESIDEGLDRSEVDKTAVTEITDLT